MNTRQVIGVIYALLVWTLVLILWVNGPHNCSAPDAHHHVTCQH